jgi:myo-inositol-1(or 4)-monophosphatase
MQPMLNIATQAAIQAAKLINQYIDRVDLLRISRKGQNDFVTEVDKKSEEIIINHIETAYPKHQILAEESGARKTESDYQWIIDPLDGTNNFIHGYPQIAISIALQYKFRTVMGLIYDPISHEIFSALDGKGAKLNRRRIRISQPKVISRSLIATGFPFRETQSIDDYMKIFQDILKCSSDIRRSGSAALDLAYLAAGRLDGYWESDLKIWDIAAGILIIKEAGGVVTDFNNEENMLESGEVIAGGKLTHGNLLKIITRYKKSHIE